MVTASENVDLRAPRSGEQKLALNVKDLWKRYGAVEAVRGITFDVAKGEIFGLIGPDGAGKTSTFQILAGVMEATSGTADVFGEHARVMRSQTGYLTQAFSLYPDLSVAENIRYTGDLRRVPPEEIEKRGLQYLRMFDMDRFTDRLAGKLSGGMKQKLALVCALVPQPQILLLDEPTTGVDPVSRREFWDTLTHLAADGLTIVVATPYLDEAERCHRIALIHQGKIQQMGTPAELTASLNAKRLELRTPDLGKAEAALSELTGADKDFIDIQRFGDHIDLLVDDPQKAIVVLNERMKGAGIVDDVRVDEPTLENVFVARLRGAGQEAHREPFPVRHDHGDLRGRVAMGATNLTKTFGGFTAVKNVNLKIQYGEVYGLLGANGAGKTTTIKMLCGLLDASSGQMELAGETSNLRSQHIRCRGLIHVAEIFFV